MFDATTIDATVAASLEYFNAGYNCAEAVLLAVSRAAGYDSPLIPRIASGLGGGIGRQGEVCGTLSGGALVVGLLHGRDRADEVEKKEAVTAKAAELVRRFAYLNGAICCRDILGVELNTEAGSREFHDRNLKSTTCSVAMIHAVRTLMELLNEWEVERG